MAFRDDYPLDPPPPDADWSQPASRNQHDSLSEVRNALAELQQLIDGLQRMTITEAAGNLVEIIGRTVGVGDPFQRFDLVDLGEGIFQLHAPVCLWRNTDVEERIAITGNAFTPEAGRWLVAKITSLTAPAIDLEMVAGSWTDYPSAYEFTGGSYDFGTARLPLYRFHATADEGRKQIGRDLYAEKLVGAGPLRLIFPLVNVPSTTHFRTVPALI